MNKPTTRKWLFTGFLFFVVLLIKGIASNRLFVEVYYSQHAYVFISHFLRILLGWLPFSVGDVLYAAVAIWLLVAIIRFIKMILKKKASKQMLISNGRKFFNFILLVYILFNALWGLNYDRKGIAYLLNLKTDQAYNYDLSFITSLLLEKTNLTRKNLPVNETYLSNQDCYNEAVAAYQNLHKEESFINYKHRSVKSSMYSLPGNYLGFSGYYNPFTAEAQVNIKMPPFLLPYVTCHEMAHQLGYASEDEANFVGYLAAKSSQDFHFQYSVYLDLFMYANGELSLYDSTKARANYKFLDTLVKQDIKTYRTFLKQYENPFEPVITRIYGSYLQANNQPEGIKTYSRVTSLLVAYYNRYRKL